MSSLKRTDVHTCPFCQYSSIRKHMKTHLTTPGKKGPRCKGLNTSIPADIWKDNIVPYYTTGTPLPDVSPYRKKRRSYGPAKRKLHTQWSEFTKSVAKLPGPHPSPLSEVFQVFIIFGSSNRRNLPKTHKMWYEP